jgi:CheY-like chemotaxis protein
VDLSRLVEEMTKLVQTSISRKIQLHLELAAEPPPVLVDPVQIQQIVMNLLMNGAEAIGADSVGTVRVATGTVDLSEGELARMTFAVEAAPGRYVYVQVQDSGCGMDEETRNKIFDPFFTTKFTGRGLGLAAVLGIVRAHRGALLVESEVGRGTSFKVMLPAAVGAVELDAGQAAEKALGTGTVLVIDDEPVVRRMAQTALERAGFDVLVAENGKAGVRHFLSARERIRLIVVDLTMPGLGGEETIRELRQLDCAVPMILSSGFNESEAGRNFDWQNTAGFLQKPYTADQLVRTVEKAVWKSGSIATTL